MRSLRTIMLVSGLCFGSIAAAADQAPLKISKPEAVKGVQSVVIGAFNVGFLFESVDNTKASGGMIGAFGGTTKAKSQLVGVTPQMMQAVTDAAYADLKAQLAAKGFTVADPAPMFASADFARVKPVASPYEASVVLEKNSTGKTSFYKPTALPGLVMMPGDFVSTGFSGMGMQMASAQTAMGMAAYAKSTSQAVIDVVYLIDFSQAKRPGAFSFGGLKVNSGLSVVAEYSRLNIVTPAGKTATVLVKQPVAVEGEFIDMADATGGGDKAMQSAANVAGGVLAALGGPGMMMGKTRKYTFTAKPGAYEEGAAKAASLTSTRIVDQLASLR